MTEKTEREVVIITDDHSNKFLKEDSRLIKFLREEYGSDSLGLEAFWNEIKDGDYSFGNDLFIKNLELKKVLINEGLWKILWKIYCNNNEIKIEELTFRNALPDLATYIKLMPIYGIEDKEILELHMIGKEISRLPNNKNDYLTLLLNECREIAKRRTDLPETGLYFGTEHKKEGVPYPKTLELKNLLEIDLRLRNNVFVRNMEKYMEKYDSKRGIVIVGAFHAFNSIPKELYSPEIKSLQELLPYSCLVIKGTSLERLDKKRDDFLQALALDKLFGGYYSISAPKKLK